MAKIDKSDIFNKFKSKFQIRIEEVKLEKLDIVFYTRNMTLQEQIAISVKMSNFDYDEGEELSKDKNLEIINSMLEIIKQFVLNEDGSRVFLNDVESQEVLNNMDIETIQSIFKVPIC